MRRPTNLLLLPLLLARLLSLVDTVYSTPCSIQLTAVLPSTTSVTYNGNNANSGVLSAPVCQANANHQDVLTYVPPTSDWYVIDTLNSLFDTVLSVTVACSSVSLACNDDAPGLNTSSVALFLTQNVTYAISVYGFSTFAQGFYQLHINPQGPTAAPTAGICAPSTFSFPGATTLPQFTVGTQTIASSTVVPIPTCQGNVLSATWFDYTPPLPATIAVNTLGSTFDTVVIVFADDSCSTQIACDDDVAGMPQSFAVVQMTAGVKYRIVVLGYSSNAEGAYRLEISTNTTIPGDPNALVYRVDHGLCYGTTNPCECDPGWTGPLCVQSVSTLTTSPSPSPSLTSSPTIMPTLTPIVSNADIVNGLILGLVILLVVGLALFAVDVYYCGGGATATTSRVVNQVVASTIDTAGRMGNTAMREMSRVANSAMSGQLPTFSYGTPPPATTNVNRPIPEFDDVMMEQQQAGAPRVLGGPGGSERRRTAPDEEQSNLIVI